jgi:hypothetical protein
MNPDGYEYVRLTYIAQNYTSSSLLEAYVKNADTRGSICPASEVGVSLRNNYPYKFGVDEIGSEGSNPCL